MSVGTGSIKRAVKAANSTEELKQEAGGNAETVTEKEGKSEGAKAAQKDRAQESAAQKTAAKKPVGKKTAAKKSAAPKVSDSVAAGEKKSAAPAGYEAYGVGQELPVYLM